MDAALSLLSFYSNTLNYVPYGCRISVLNHYSPLKSPAVAILNHSIYRLTTGCLQAVLTNHSWNRCIINDSTDTVFSHVKGMLLLKRSVNKSCMKGRRLAHKCDLSKLICQAETGVMLCRACIERFLLTVSISSKCSHTCCRELSSAQSILYSLNNCTMGYNWNSRCLQRVSWNKTICQSLTQTVAIHNGFEKLVVFST